MSVSSTKKNDHKDISVTEATGEDKVKKYDTLDDVRKNATENNECSADKDMKVEELRNAIVHKVEALKKSISYVGTST